MTNKIISNDESFRNANDKSKYADMTWQNDRDNMLIRVYNRVTGETLFNISVHEIIESSSRAKVVKHVKDCDDSAWLSRWQAEKHGELMDALKANYNEDFIE
jgi:hypothetical protein